MSMQSVWYHVSHESHATAGRLQVQAFEQIPHGYLGPGLSSKSPESKSKVESQERGLFEIKFEDRKFGEGLFFKRCRLEERRLKWVNFEKEDEEEGGKTSGLSLSVESS